MDERRVRDERSFGDRDHVALTRGLWDCFGGLLHLFDVEKCFREVEVELFRYLWFGGWETRTVGDDECIE